MMQRWLWAMAAVGVVACGGGGDGGTEALTSEPGSRELTVRVTAEEVLGCVESTTRSGTDVAAGGPLTVEDQDGTVVGSGVFELSAGADVVCDWFATVDVEDGAEFYTLRSGGELWTFSRADLETERWRVHLHIAITGDVEPAR